jgi:hypothetical protein
VPSLGSLKDFAGVDEEPEGVAARAGVAGSEVGPARGGDGRGAGTDLADGAGLPAAAEGSAVEGEGEGLDDVAVAARPPAGAAVGGRLHADRARATKTVSHTLGVVCDGRLAPSLWRTRRFNPMSPRNLDAPRSRNARVACCQPAMLSVSWGPDGEGPRTSFGHPRIGELLAPPNQ